VRRRQSPSGACRDGETGGDARQGAGEGDQQALGGHRPAHAPAGCAERPQHADLARALEDEHGERVHDAEHADQHGDRDDRVEEAELLVDGVGRLFLNRWLESSGREARAAIAS
jgi:hypothetical protein